MPHLDETWFQDAHDDTQIMGYRSAGRPEISLHATAPGNAGGVLIDLDPREARRLGEWLISKAPDPEKLAEEIRGIWAEVH